MRRFGAAVSGLLLLALSTEGIRAGGTPSYEVRRATVTAFANFSSSPGYRNIMSTSMVMGAAGTCPNGTASTMGFWSILGPGSVPIVLRASKDHSGATGVQLSWSGQADSFSVFRSSSPVAVVAPGNVVATSKSCEHIDEAPGLTQLFFYRVVASEFKDPESEAR